MISENLRSLSRQAAMTIAQQLADGSLDPFPMDQSAAQDRLQFHLANGDITPDDLRKMGLSV